VRIPMMPKGVEHSSGQDQHGMMIRENSDDPERR